MLVLSRKSLQTIVFGGADGSERQVKVTVLEIKHGKVKLGFEAPGDVRIHRSEIQDLPDSRLRPATEPESLDAAAAW